MWTAEEVQRYQRVFPVGTKARLPVSAHNKQRGLLTNLFRNSSPEPLHCREPTSFDFLIGGQERLRHRIADVVVWGRAFSDS
ncbi:MAG: hypothetical protein K2P94_08415 [Rhodospirillaceae bacterium]|nr:hypothetical protein [Rhodospirillaceae bacterium]